MKFLGCLGLWLLVVWLGWMPVAHAEICGDRNGQKVCIVRIKRSAKNYWEYRAQVNIAGNKQIGEEIYNCRDHTLTRQGKYPIFFQLDSPEAKVCALFYDK